MTELYVVLVLMAVALVIAMVAIRDLQIKNWKLQDQLAEAIDDVKTRDAVVDLFTDFRD